MAHSSVRIVSGLHDEPHLKRRRVTVRQLRGLVEGAGKSAEEPAAQFDLDIADVHGAIEYYHSHPEEMAAAEKQRAEGVATARESGAASIAEFSWEGDEWPNGISDTRRREHESADRRVAPWQKNHCRTRPRSAPRSIEHVSYPAHIH